MKVSHFCYWKLSSNSWAVVLTNVQISLYRWRKINSEVLQGLVRTTCIWDLYKWSIWQNNFSWHVNEWCAITLACTLTHHYLFRCAIVACAKLYMTSLLHTNTSTSVLSYPFTNNSFAISLVKVNFTNSCRHWL